jgi:hypothetical protein
MIFFAFLLSYTVLSHLSLRIFVRLSEFDTENETRGENAWKIERIVVLLRFSPRDNENNYFERFQLCYFLITVTSNPTIFKILRLLCYLHVDDRIRYLYK